jgi:hypothetical protein
MTVAETASTKYGAALQEQNYYESVRQAMLAKGVPLSANYVAGVNAEVDALMRRNKALQSQQFVQSTLGAIVDPLLQDQMLLQNKAAMYSQLETLRQGDLANEKAYQQARYALDAMYAEKRLAGASQFFGTMSGLSRSGNKKLAAIGKAAAVAQATIDGYLAVQKTLATVPPPWNVPAAAAVAVMTGAQVAGIMSTNVGSFATGGQFTVDGKAGVDNNNVNMNVSRGERVTIETPAQQRAAEGKGNGTPNITVPIKNYIIRDPREIHEVMRSPEGKREILNIIREHPQEVAAAIGTSH